MQALIPANLGMEVSGVWRPSPTATELTAEMTAIEAANTDIIMPIISGPLGIAYAKSWGELEVPAASVGINVESQKDGFWEATGGFGNYETTLNTYAEGVAMTEKTQPFIEAFKAKTGQMPTYTAGTNDAILLLVEAIERAGTLDADAVVVELEKTDYISTGGRIMFTGLEDAPLGNPHDVVYSPGYVTGLATQWQDGANKSVWPNLMPAGDWEGVFYEGTVMWQAPPRLIEKLKAEAAEE
jgi:branched-chain amino acid transport system substrate-binding protein